MYKCVLHPFLDQLGCGSQGVFVSSSEQTTMLSHAFATFLYACLCACHNLSVSSSELAKHMLNDAHPIAIVLYVHVLVTTCEFL